MLATGSAINYIGQTSSASEPYLMEFTARLSGTANQAKLTQAQVLGYASVLDQNMQQVEMSASAMQKLILKMMQKPAKFAEMAGLEVKKFSDLLKNDANQAILTLIDSLSKKGGLSQLAPIFQDMGLDGVRASGVISVLANNIDKIRTEQEKATQAYNKGTSVIDEYNIKNNNMQASLEKARKKFQDMRLELGEKLYPLLIKLTSTGTAGIKLLSKLIKFISENKGAVIAIIAPYTLYLAKLLLVRTYQGAVNILTKAWNVILSTTKTLVYAASAAYNTMTKNTSRAAAAQRLLKTTFAETPWGAILTIVTALSVAIVKYIKRTNEAEKAIKEFNEQSAKEESQATYLFDALKKTTEGSVEYKKELERLKKLYPDIIQAHLDEKGALQDINTAYQEVITSIRAKIAAQVQEQETSKIIEKDIETQRKQYGEIKKMLSSGANKNLSEAAKQDFLEAVKIAVSESKDINSFYSKLSEAAKKYNVVLRDTSAWADSRNINKPAAKIFFSADKAKKKIDEISESFKNLIEDDSIEKLEKKLKDLTKALRDSKTSEERNKYENEIIALSKLIKLRKKEEEITTNNKENGDDTQTPDEKAEKKWKEFYEKIQDFRRKQNNDQLSEFQKEKAQIILEYDQMIREAKDFGEKGKKIAEDLEKEKWEVVTKAGKKYIKKYNEVIEKINSAAAKQGLKEENNPLVQKLRTSDQEWDKIIKDYEDSLDELEKMFLSVSDPEEAAQIMKLLGETYDKQLEAIKKKSADQVEIIKDSQKEITDILTEEQEKQIKEIQKKYDALILIAQTSIDELKKNDADGNAALIENLEKQIEELKKQLGIEIKKVKIGNGVWADFFTLDWDSILKNWQDNISIIVNTVQEAYQSIGSIISDISTIQNNAAESELNTFKETQDEKIEALEKRYDKGLISENYYNQEKEKLEDETDAKEKEVALEQWKRNKKVAIAEANIQGILASVKSFASLGYPWGLIPMALSIATTIAQVAAIESEPEPYARGGYVKKETVFKAGEAGEEWVANHSLLKDKKTAGVISELEAYQRGKNSIFDNMNVSVPDQKNLSQAASAISHNFVTSNTPIINNYYQNNSNDNETITEMLREFKKFTNYMKDPENRRASVDRKLLSEFDNNESFLRNKSVL